MAFLGLRKALEPISIVFCGVRGSYLPGYSSNAKNEVEKPIFAFGRLANFNWNFMFDVVGFRFFVGAAITRPIFVEVRQFRYCETSICVYYGQWY